MSKQGKTHEITDYLWCRIRKRMKTLGISNKALADMVEQSESNVSRMLRQDVRSIVYLDQLREALVLPEDDLESQYSEHAKDLQEILARVMATDGSIAELFLEDVAYLANFYRQVHEVREHLTVTEAVARQADSSEKKTEAMERFKSLKKQEADLAKKRRELNRILS